uniref:Uncharacterized protein n=1 Tax=Oryza meridionalis TaxID=40149 RepID=A0A0E0EV92_9ORYZ
MSDLATGAPDTSFATPVNSRRLALGDTAAATHGSLPPPFLFGGELLGASCSAMALPNSCNNHLTEALEGAKSQVPKPVNS